jgi:hypothetical protein
VNKKEIAEMFVNHFASVFNEPMKSKPMHVPDEDMSGEQSDFMRNFEITEKMVLEKLRKLPMKETLSADGLPPIVFKQCANTLLKPIVYLLKLSVANGQIPESWRHILVQPTHKKGCRKLIKNYRPIGLTNILSKVCERIVRDQMIRYLSSQGMESDLQHGFRPRRSTITSLLQTQLEWKGMLRMNDKFYVVYLDFSKAFDVVDHTVLKTKLYNAGFRDNALRWIGDYLDRRTMSVILDGEESSARKVHSGVIQGSAAGPALFSFFSHDIPQTTDGTSGMGLFADDIKNYAMVKENLQNSIDDIVHWSKQNVLPLAPDKTEFMIVRRRQKALAPETIMVDGVTIHSTNEVRDLGIRIMDDLECVAQVTEMTTKAFKVAN